MCDLLGNVNRLRKPAYRYGVFPSGFQRHLNRYDTELIAVQRVELGGDQLIAVVYIRVESAVRAVVPWASNGVYSPLPEP